MIFTPENRPLFYFLGMLNVKSDVKFDAPARIVYI